MRKMRSKWLALAGIIAAAMVCGAVWFSPSPAIYHFSVSPMRPVKSGERVTVAWATRDGAVLHYVYHTESGQDLFGDTRIMEIPVGAMEIEVTNFGRDDVNSVEISLIVTESSDGQPPFITATHSIEIPFTQGDSE